jgi:hypothetical protein
MSTADTRTIDRSGAPASVRQDKQPSSWVRRVIGVAAAWSTAWWLLLGALLAPAHFG